MVAQTCKFTKKPTELNTLKEWIIWYMNYFSIKLLFLKISQTSELDKHGAHLEAAQLKLKELYRFQPMPATGISWEFWVQLRQTQECNRIQILQYIVHNVQDIVQNY